MNFEINYMKTVMSSGPHPKNAHQVDQQQHGWTRLGVDWTDHMLCPAR